ncbi:MAG: DrmB family protein, partial [Anaerolineae bacterium]
MTQLIRRSQFITIYGPGAILEGPEGPRVIPVLAHSELFNQQRRPINFEITDLRLSQALLNGTGILRLPSNAEINELDSNWIYSTDPFPRWALCVRHGVLYRKTNYSDARACPRCEPLGNKFEAWKQVHRQAIRFVRACAAGHLDDVNWVGIISHNRNDCSPSFLFWRGGGGSLRQIDIVCPICNASINLGIAYSREWPCSGCFPEWDRNHRPGNCDQPSKIIQRGAANLRISELQTSLTIPPRSTPLHRQLEITNVQSILLSQVIQSKQALLNALQPLVARNLLRQAVVMVISNYSESEILAAINDTVAGTLPADARSLRLEELHALRYAATYGAPPTQSSRPGDPHQFEVVQAQVRTIVAPNGQELRVTPVNRLRVVMVQTGYRRLDPLNDPVDCVYDDGQRNWYPGVELFGEGIFIDLTPGNQSNAPARHFPLVGSAANTWFDAWIDPQRYDPRFIPEIQDQFHPVFIWWHTLAHRLINALSVDSGYSSAAVRERVYVDIDEDTGDAGGGILLYTVQPGGDDHGRRPGRSLLAGVAAQQEGGGGKGHHDPDAAVGDEHGGSAGRGADGPVPPVLASVGE